MPEVSVIVPVYNAEKYLHRCIDSILAQIFTDFELLLIDDGSTDRGGVICDEYEEKDTRIHVIHQENRGLSAARNRGIKHSTGKWLMFCDDDDTVTPDWVETLYHYATEYPDRLVNCEYASVKQNGMKEEKRIFEYKHISFLEKEDYYNIWYKGYSWPIWNRIFSSEIIKNRGIIFDEDMNRGGEDAVFVANYLKTISCRMLFVPRCCYHWIDNDGNSTSRRINYSCYDKLKKTHLARIKLIDQKYIQEYYNKEFFVVFHEGLIPAVKSKNGAYVTQVLHDPVFLEICNNADNDALPFKLRMILFSKKYSIVKHMLNA